MSNGRIGPPWWLMGRGTGGSRTVSGAVAHWEDKVVAPLRSLVANIEPVQEGTGDPSPDNVRPISGWSAVKVWVKPTYDPTANPTATIQLGDTYYGGTLDVTTGVLTVDRVAISLDENEWADPGDNVVLTTKDAVLAGRYKSAETGSAARIIYGLSNYFPTNSTGALVVVRSNGVSSDKFQIVDYKTTFSVSSYQEFLAIVGAVPIQVVYELATPITIPLTATEISTLQGENNVWADSGDVTVTYLSGEGNPALVALALAHRIEE